MTPNKLTIDQVFSLIREERKYQDAKFGKLEDKPQSVAGFMLVMRNELAEAEAGWTKNLDGRSSALAEIIQVAATAVACLEKYGREGNPL